MTGSSSVLLEADCGTGKTLATLDAARATGHRALILCPLSVMQSAWIADAKKFHPDLNVKCLWSKSPAKRMELIRSEWTIGVMNYESFKACSEALIHAGVKILVLDESSKIKDPTTQITKAVARFAECMDHVWELSATPAPNDESEYIPQMLVMNPGTFAVQGRPRRYSETFNHFFTQHKKMMRGRMIPVGRPKLIASRKDEFFACIDPLRMVIRKRDCLDLPDQVDSIREVSLDDNEIRAYMSMKLSLRAEIENGVFNASNAAVAAMKLRQITSGFLYTGGGRSEPIGASKIKELADLLGGELHGKQVVIWSVFTEEIRRIVEALTPELAGVIDGSVPHETRAADIARFQSGALQYMVCHPAAAGHGVTLTAASDAVYMSMDFSSERYVQSRDRIHRIGQTSKCTYHHLIAPLTVDEKILNVLQGKCSMMEACKEMVE